MDALAVVRAGTVPYETASEWQRDLHRRRVVGEVPDVLLLLEHPHVYTLGRRFTAEHLLLDRTRLAERGISVHEADRGGSVTYHGPGQLVGYPIIELARPSHPAARSEPDTIRYLRLLEEALIRSVRSLGVVAGRRDRLTGVWVGTAKLASIGVNVSRGVSKHGFALNVSTDLTFFDGMVPCGIQDVALTSLSRILARDVPMPEVCDLVTAHLGALLHRRPVPASPADLGLAGGVGETSAARMGGDPHAGPASETQQAARVIQFPRAEES